MGYGVGARWVYCMKVADGEVVMDIVSLPLAYK